ncbi:MAG: phosphatase PAP2 family protein [Acidobacteriota bacterium]
MTELDRHLALAINGAIGASPSAFEVALLMAGAVPLVGCVTVMLFLWWTDLEGHAGQRMPVLGEGPAPDRPGLRLSRRRCVSLATCTAAAFVCTRLIAFGTEWPRPLARESLVVPIDATRWNHLVDGMTGFGAFPSDHAALFFALAVGLFAWRLSWGLIGLGSAGVLSMLRVGLGFHYPSDMVAGALIGAFFGMIATRLARRPGLFDGVVAAFDRHPAILYPLLFVVALDFTQHFRLVFKSVFFVVLTFLGH